MIQESSRFKTREGVVLSGEGDARYVTDISTGTVYELNETAVLIFETAGRGEPLSMVVDVLSKTYPDVPREEISRDARQAVEEFVSRGLLVEAKDPA